MWRQSQKDEKRREMLMLPNQKQILSIEPTLRHIHGKLGFRKLKAPYLDFTAMEQLVVFSFLLALEIDTPANDLHGDDYGWFY